MSAMRVPIAAMNSVTCFQQSLHPVRLAAAPVGQSYKEQR